MVFLGIIVITLTTIGVMAWLSPESDEPKKPWKPKKRLFSNSEMDYSKLHFK